MLVAIVAFCAGHFTADGPTAPAARDTTVAPSEATAGDAAVVIDVSNRPTAGAAVVLSDDQARARTFEVLSVPDRVDRMRQLCELLRSATAENWRGIVDAFIRQTTTMGRRQTDEFRFAMERVGEVAGSAAIEEVRASNKFGDMEDAQRSAQFLMTTGWAAADPKAAQAWLEVQPPEVQKMLATGLIDGMAQSDPKSALAFAAARGPDFWKTVAAQIANGAFQHGGFREGAELLATVRERGDITVFMKRTLFYEFAMRQIDAARLRGESAGALDWADQYIDSSLMGPLAAKEIVNFAAHGDLPATLNWIEARADRWTPEQAAIVFPAIAQAMQTQAPEQFAAWMNANPEHPQHDVMAQAVARQLLQNGNPGEARRWSQAINDPAMRASMDQTLKATEDKLRRNDSQ
jgi:hypothetical protein